MAVLNVGSPLSVQTFSPLTKNDAGKYLHHSSENSISEGLLRDSYREKVYIPESACEIERNIHKFLDS